MAQIAVIALRLSVKVRCFCKTRTGCAGNRSYWLICFLLRSGCCARYSSGFANNRGYSYTIRNGGERGFNDAKLEVGMDTGTAKIGALYGSRFIIVTDVCDADLSAVW